MLRKGRRLIRKVGEPVILIELLENSLCYFYFTHFGGLQLCRLEFNTGAASARLQRCTVCKIEQSNRRKVDNACHNREGRRGGFQVIIGLGRDATQSLKMT